MGLPPLATQWWRKGLSPWATLRWHAVGDAAMPRVPASVGNAVVAQATWACLRGQRSGGTRACCRGRRCGGAGPDAVDAVGVAHGPDAVGDAVVAQGPVAVGDVAMARVPAAVGEVAMAKADAAREGHRHRGCGRGRCLPPRWRGRWRAAPCCGCRSQAQGAMLRWPKLTPPARASVIVGAGVAAAVRRDGVGTGGRRRVGWPKPGARPRVQLAEADAVREGQRHRGRGRSRCRSP